MARVHRSAGNQAVQRQESDESESRGLQPIEDPGAYDVGVSRETLLRTVASFLEDRGITPPPGSDLELRDYVSATAWQSAGSYSNTTASVRVGHDGTLLPSAEYLDEHRPEGGYAESSLQPATRMLQFQVNPVGDGSALVVSRLTRVESSVIKKQEDAWSDDSVGGYLRGLDESLEKSGIEIGRAGTGRVPPGERRYRDRPGDPAGGLTSEGASPTAGGTGAGAASGTAAETEGGGRERESGPTSPEKEPTGTPVGPAATGGGGARDREYEVQRGDTLWDIAEREYGDPQLWAAIYESPENDIADPDLIHPGQTLVLPTQSEAEAFDQQGYTPPPSLGVGQGAF
ncbi:MAG: LysM peptidoglycan-binding domain-containing protein [Haloarculaceae archaeon]